MLLGTDPNARPGFVQSPLLFTFQGKGERQHTGLISDAQAISHGDTPKERAMW